jgi:hypothetical protein
VVVAQAELVQKRNPNSATRPSKDH